MGVRTAVVIMAALLLGGGCSKVKRDAEAEQREPGKPEQPLPEPTRAPATARELLGYLTAETRAVYVVNFATVGKSTLFDPVKKKLAGARAEDLAAVERECGLDPRRPGGHLVIGSEQLEGGGESMLILGGVTLGEDRLADCVGRVASKRGFAFELGRAGIRRIAHLSPKRSAGVPAPGVLLLGPRAWVERVLTTPQPRLIPPALLGDVLGDTEIEQDTHLIGAGLDQMPGTMGKEFKSLKVHLRASDGQLKVDARMRALGEERATGIAKQINDMSPAMSSTFGKITAAAQGEVVTLAMELEESRAASLLGVVLP